MCCIISSTEDPSDVSNLIFAPNGRQMARFCDMGLKIACGKKDMEGQVLFANNRKVGVNLIQALIFPSFLSNVDNVI